MLRRGKPREIIWCMGMNDGDKTDAINDKWQADLEELIAICELNGITLVLATIPNCPSINNTYKNEYVVQSGYRYIDFAGAVGSQSCSNWYTGMLEEGEGACHPTEKGAMALFSEAVATCPELLRG